MDEGKTTVIVGPPGTGKTTALLEIVDEHLEAGLGPADICLVTFTRKAAQEARERAAAKFGLHEDEFKYFRTLHSLAFQELNVTQADMMKPADYLSIAKSLGIYLTMKKADDEESIIQSTMGDRLMFTYNLARVRDVSLKEMWESEPDEDLDWFELEQLAETMMNYKWSHEKMDFTDLILRYTSNMESLPCRILMVDEAQDLSRIQWNLVEKLAESVDEVFLAGDDDQAIFKWAGADVDTFIDMKGSVMVLDQSYRVPDTVRKVANEIAGRIHHRRDKIWYPSSDGGEVEYVTHVDQIDMSQGTWYLLSRNRFFLSDFDQYCEEMGYAFQSMTSDLYGSDVLQAMKTWEWLRKGRKARASDVAIMYDYMSVKNKIRYGSKKRLKELEESVQLGLNDLKQDFGLMTDEIWHEALDRISDEDREYFLSALKNGENLMQDPRIKVSTIHGVKGGEADNVVLCVDMTARTYDSYQRNEDDELRVWYVGATRARKRLYILEPLTTRYVNLV